MSSGKAEAVVIDALGQACPLPVIRLARAVGDVAVGEEVLVLADDPGAKVDIPVWCRMKQQTLAGVEQRDAGWAFRVRRAS
jgi:TusA-related sulfurtransferase